MLAFYLFHHGGFTTFEDFEKCFECVPMPKREDIPQLTFNQLITPDKKYLKVIKIKNGVVLTRSIPDDSEFHEMIKRIADEPDVKIFRINDEQYDYYFESE